MKWFKHDSTAHRDTKLKRLKRRHGIVGYGLYWYCLELIAGSVDKNNITFELEDDSEEIAFEWGLDRVTVSEIMQYMVELELFETSDNRVRCPKMALRMDDTNSRNPEIQAMQKRLRESPKRLRSNSEASSDRLDKTRLDENRTDHDFPIHEENCTGIAVDTDTGEVKW